MKKQLSFLSKKLPTLVAAAIISLVIGTSFAAWNDHKGPGSPILSADWNAMVAEINSKISTFTEADPKVGSLSVSYFPKWSSASNALVNSSLYESADTKLVAKGVDQGVSNYVANFIDSLSNSLLLVRNDGKVGIGTTTPSAKLEVAGEIKFGNTSSTCNAANEGQQRYNSSSKNMEFCNGTVWGAISGTPAVSSPIGAIVAWHKSLTNTPALPSGWVECNGQVLSDANSSYNGQTIPNLNSATQDGSVNSGMFLRGGMTSGVLQADSTSVNGLNVAITGGNGVTSIGTFGISGGGSTISYAQGGLSASMSSTDTETRPANMTVVWIMRVK